MRSHTNTQLLLDAAECMLQCANGGSMLRTVVDELLRHDPNRSLALALRGKALAAMRKFDVRN
jgi:hypothetical protein